jgi:hypothetical protein
MSLGKSNTWNRDRVPEPLKTFRDLRERVKVIAAPLCNTISEEAEEHFCVEIYEKA